MLRLSSALRSRANIHMATPHHTMKLLRERRLEWGTTFAPRMLLADWHIDKGWSEPRIAPYGPLQLAPSTVVFHYAMEVFEGLKAFRNGDDVRLFRPDLNIARLNKSAERLALPQVDASKMLHMISGLVHDVRDWVPHSSDGSLYIRPAIIGTDPRIGVRRSDSALLFIIASPVGSFFSSRNSNLLDGVRLRADPSYTRAWPGGVGYCKTGGNYGSCIAPTEKAKKDGFDQILWLSDAKKRLVSEVGMMNVFFVREDSNGRSLITPRLDGTILDGVTRRSILQLAKEMGIKTEERDISIDEVFSGVRSGNVVEMFGSGTAAVISPVWSVECEGDTVEVKRTEDANDLSVAFREQLLRIQRGQDEHDWMVTVGAEDVGDGAEGRTTTA